jgi:AcrR family transcriptional regulator
MSYKGLKNMPPKPKFAREDVVEAAFNLVRKHGWDGLSARSIAQELNSSTQPIYSHLKSIKDLKKEIVKKIYELLFSYGTTKRTGDPWVDVGLGYVLFAKEEKQLFRCLGDEERMPLFKKYADKSFSAVTETLSNYPPFQGLSNEQIDKVRRLGFIFAFGLAVLVNRSFTKTLTCEEEIACFIRMADQTILKGFKATLEEDKE